MSSGTYIESISTMVSRAVNITVNGEIYSHKLKDPSELLSILSMFTNTQQQPIDKSQAEYSCTTLSNNGTSSNEVITKEKFDLVFNQLPDAVTRVCTNRLDKAAGRRIAAALLPISPPVNEPIQARPNF